MVVTLKGEVTEGAKDRVIKMGKTEVSEKLRRHR